VSTHPPPSATSPSGLPWKDAPLDEVCRHLVEYHHERTRELLGTTRLILGETIAAYPGRAELVELGRLLTVLEQDMSRHMVVEELVLFPYVERLWDGADGRGPAAVPHAHAEGAIHVAQHDHENAMALVAGIRALAERLRDDPDLDRMYQALVTLEDDLRVHSSLEEDVLFPRLHALEDHLARGPRRHDR
jgi:regulator of cell morphogenesis and NO signaling